MTTKSQQTWAADGRYEHIQRPVDIKTTVVVPGVELWSLVNPHIPVRAICLPPC